MKVGYRDLREFIELLEDEGELAKINAEVDWKYEISGWVWKSLRTNPYGPALLFNNIKDYSKNRIFTNGLASYSRIALAMGLQKDTSIKELVDEFIRRIETPVEPITVKRASAKENIMVDADVDVSKFPAPYWHPRDGGRYIGTWYALISKDPETGERNVGLYRVMVVDKNKLAIGFNPFSHLDIHYAKAKIMNKPLPVTMAIGVDELLVMAAASPFPLGVD